MSQPLIEQLIRSHAFQAQSEAQLQASLEAVLSEGGIPFEREPQLSPSCRPDFLCEGGICVEVKVDGSAMELARQVARYVELPEVTSVLVVTTRCRHQEIPTSLGGKPICVLHLLTGIL